MLKTALIVITLIISGAVFGQDLLRTSMSLDDLRAFTESALEVNEIRQMIGSGNKTIRFEISGSAATATINDYEFTGFSNEASADYTITMPIDAALAIANSPDRTFTLKALLEKKVLRVDAADPVKDALIETAISSGLVETGAPPSGEGFVLNEFGARIGSLGAKHQLYANPPSTIVVSFSGFPPGLLTQRPGLIYQSMIESPAKKLMDMFKQDLTIANRNNFLSLDIFNADFGSRDPNQSNSVELAYLLGVGARDTLAKSLHEDKLVNDNTVNIAGRWDRP